MGTERNMRVTEIAEGKENEGQAGNGMGRGETVGKNKRER